MIKRILSVALCALMLVACVACQKTQTTGGDLAEITEKGKMVIGYTDYAPMNYFDDNGNLTGFDTEFAIAVCEKLGVEPDFIEIEWELKYTELEAKSIDCIWNGLTITEEAKLNTNVTKPYVKNAQVVVMKKDKIASCTTVDSLKGLKVAAEAGSAGAAAIKDNALDENFIECADQTGAVLEVLSGSADACVIDITMAKAMIGEGTSYADLGYGLELTSEEYGIAFRKDSDVTAKVNEIIDELKADGTLDALAQKYELNLAF